ncbi:ImmA/IrrE family metallo-endopeptidase [Marinisporobacter balticus]|uniref:Uncharacterized protein DUF955 n=1 Tax=Marinisporobacter balticus TaxID=2018667 RepID=A0A4R2L522_9FIRM|nr:ImmA/IrrE family metallo-endopeptidase [Marinisporobacter balticus]TCO79089.1 uncharacterized protein DUF955 [Marinisporobacter balticus]
MIETSELENIIHKYHIIKEFTSLPESALGFYFYDGDYSMILISESLKNNERLYRTILAEEIGHFMTTVGDITPRRYLRYSEQIEIDKKELVALRWAVDFLLPTQMVLEVLRDRKACTVDELVDYFYVTKDFLMKKFEFMAKEKPIWKIDGKRCLYLYKLPSVFIYE